MRKVEEHKERSTINFPFFFLLFSHCSMSDLHGLQPTRLLCPWDFPGKNTGVGCCFLLQGIFSPRNQMPSLALAGIVFTTKPPGKPNITYQFSSVQLFSRVRLFATPWTVTCQAPLSMDFSRQEYWTGLLFPSPGDLPDPGIESVSRELQVDSSPLVPLGKPYGLFLCTKYLFPTSQIHVLKPWLLFSC